MCSHSDLPSSHRRKRRRGRDNGPWAPPLGLVVIGLSVGFLAVMLGLFIALWLMATAPVTGELNPIPTERFR